MQLKPVLGPVQLTFYSIGVIVGAGVYSIIGPAAGLAQDGLWLSFVIGAVVAFLTAAAYAEMATAFPTAGAEYIYVRRAFPDAAWASFGVGVVILIGGAATAATVAVSFGGYLRVFVNVPPLLSAIALILACTAFNVWGMRESSWANIVLTCVEVSGLVIVIAAGLMHGDVVAPLAADVHPGLMAGAALLFFVYLGFEDVANMVEEVRDPARDVPIALFASVAVTTVLYVLVALSVVALAAPDELAASGAPLALAIERVWPGAQGALSGIALFATANTVLITLIATSRMAFSMARDREIPRVFAGLMPVRHTPWAAALLAMGMAMLLVPVGSLRLLAEMSSFAALLAFLSVNLSLIVLRYRLPDHPRPFRAGGAVGRLPLIPAIAIASIALLLVNFDWEIYAAGAIALVLSAIAFLVRRAAR